MQLGPQPQEPWFRRRGVQVPGGILLILASLAATQIIGARVWSRRVSRLYSWVHTANLNAKEFGLDIPPGYEVATATASETECLGVWFVYKPPRYCWLTYLMGVESEVFSINVRCETGARRFRASFHSD